MLPGASEFGITVNGASQAVSPGWVRFTFTTGPFYIFSTAAAGSTVTAWLGDAANTCAYARFNDPGTQTDNGILVTDAWRSDGGRGRAWRILPGNNPQEIELNGQHVWDTARLVQCHNAMVLLRHGNERHYFDTTALNDATEKITLTGPPSWPVGTSDRVRFELATPGAAILGSTPPGAGNYYYARHFSGNAIKLYQDSSNALADTNCLNFTTAGSTGKFFIERVTNPEPFFGNGALPLIMQPTVEGVTAFENGFKPVTDNVDITDTTTSIIEAPNHRLVFGDSVTGAASGLKQSTGPDVFVVWPKYAAPQSDHTLRLYDTELQALADDGATGLQALASGQTGLYLKRTGAAALAMPSAREGLYFKGRLVLINGRDNLMVSDPHDYLHFTQWTGTVSANLGEAGQALWLAALGDDALLIGKEQCVLIITGLGGDSSGWAMDDVTREYGGVASLAAVNVGTDLWMLSRKGVASIIRTVAGETQGVARTVSHSIPEDLADVDWVYAHQACAAMWDNRFFVALPGKNQTDVVNNRVLVCNLINGGLRVEQAVVNGDLVGGVTESGGRVDAWEGTWTGDLLIPYAFARLSVFGEERLTFATPDGLVCWLHDGWDDAGAEIETAMTTRGYFGGREVLALKGSLQLESFRPSYSVSVQTQGHNESTAIITAQTNDATAYLTYGTAAYVPASSTSATFSAPHREDYSPTADELLTAELDIHQNITESLPMRERDRSPALVITNTQGSLRVVTASISALPVGIQASRKT